MADAIYNTGVLIRGGSPPIKIPCSTEVKAGEKVVWVASKAKRVSTLGDSGTLAQNQEAAHDIALGVALDSNIDGDTKDILVAWDGECKSPCAAPGSDQAVGAFVGPAGTGTAGAVGLSDTIMVVVATANLAWGKLSRPLLSADTIMYYNLDAALVSPHGGTQAFA